MINSLYNRFKIEQLIVQGSKSQIQNSTIPIKMKGRFRLPLRFKISLPYLLLTIALGLFGAFILTRIVFDTVEDRFQNQLLEAGKINHEWLVDKESSMLETVRYIANIQGIANLINNQDKKSLGDYVYPIALNDELDSIRILDNHGKQIVGMDHKKGGNLEEYNFYSDPYDFTNFDVVVNIIEQKTDDLGDKYAGFYEYYYLKRLYIGGPIFNSDGSLIGIVLVGEYIDSIIADMRTSTLTQVSFFGKTGNVIASSFQSPINLDTNIVSSVLSDDFSESYIRDVEIYDISYGEVLSPLVIRGKQIIGIQGNALTKNFFMYSTFVTQIQIIIFIVTAIGLVLIFGLIISRFVSNPIEKLINASKLVASGNYSVSINAFTGDEIEILATSFNSMVSAVQNSKKEIIDAYDRSLDGWSRALELRDKETDYHSQRVADLTVKVAERIGIPPDDIQHMRRGALLHDIGKMGIPDEILLKPAKLDDREWSIMKKHPTFAMDMLKDVPFLHKSIEIPYFHHEKWNGSGYPNQLQGEDIPLSARIFAIVDVWDAMGSDRPYRKALGKYTILKYIKEEKGHHFDPKVVNAFLEVIKEETK